MVSTPQYAKAKGRAARHLGLPATDNPYTGTTALARMMAHYWRQGWTEVQQEASK